MAYSRFTAPRSGRTRSSDREQAAHGQRHSLGSAHRRAVARHAGAIRQLKLSLRAVHPQEQARRVGLSIRNWRVSGLQPTRSMPSIPPFARRVLDQNPPPHDAKGNPLTFDVTSGEAHEVKGYDALMELHDNDPDRLLGDKGYRSEEHTSELQSLRQ